MATDIENVISSVENSNPNADILFDLDTGEGESGEAEDLISKATEEAGEKEEEEGETKPETSEEEEGEEAEETEEDSEDKEGDKKEAKEEVKEDKKPLRKKPVYIKDGEEEMKLSPQALIRVKEDGAYKEVPLAELTESYSSSQANAKKYFELKKREEELGGFAKKTREEAEQYVSGSKQQIAELTECLNNLAASAQKGNALAAVGELFERVGVDAYPVLKNIRNELVKHAASYLQLTEERREYVDLKDELEYRKSREEKLAKRREQTEAETRKRRAIEEAVSKFKVPDFSTAQEIYRKFEQLKQEGKYQGEITSDAVGGFWNYYNTGTFALKVTEKVAPHLVKDEVVMKKVMEVIRTFNPTEEQLAEVIKRSFLGSDSKDKGPQDTEKKKLSFQQKSPAKSNGTKPSGKKESLFL